MKNQKLYIEIKNNSSPVSLADIPVLEYEVFYNQLGGMLKNESKHCLAYYGIKAGDRLRFYCCIADDSKSTIALFAHEQSGSDKVLRSITPLCPQVHIFEREIHENYGILFDGHPWLKPVRFPHEKFAWSKGMKDYPFYRIDSEELHQVGVGPIHAGVIEPGHFRFICNGEKVLHLEIQLGYQHRGIEKLLSEKNKALQRCILSESIAGDTSVGHALAHSQLIESLAGKEASEALQIERCIALEMERLAIHIGDTAALCGDVAYQLGQVVCEALRTMIINTLQFWCGNRFGKGLVRPGGSNYPLTEAIAKEILKVTYDTGRRFAEMTDCIYSLPSVLGRFEDIGIVTRQQVSDIGAVGMAARAAGLPRDTRRTHPFQYYRNYPVELVLMEKGDVLARGMLRSLEAAESVRIIREMTGLWKAEKDRITKPLYDYTLKPDSLSVSVVEGWRGEICHCAITDKNGEILHYKVKDPSFHNWMALALAVRNQEISDFPVCNKSFNLSYCGHDL